MGAIIKNVIRLSDCKRMPWKNGLGVTTEIAVFPHDADFAKGEFIWRLSSAHVETDNQFSQFEGFDRKLIVLKGDGLILNGFSLPPNQVFSFPGEEIIKCVMVGDKVEDLGVIYKRDRSQCQMSIVEVNEKSMDLELDVGTHFLTALKGDFRIDNTVIGVGDFLQLEDRQRITLRTLNFASLALVISIAVDAKLGA